jgi:hypothetical protein
MTREKAIQVTNLRCKIEAYETLRDELAGLRTLEEIRQAYADDIEEELIAVVQPMLDKLLKELEEM